jgi:hypothetical protein
MKLNTLTGYTFGMGPKLGQQSHQARSASSSSSVRPRLRMLFLMSLHVSESAWWMQKNAPFLRRSLPSPLHLPLNQHRLYLSTRANCSLSSKLRSRSASSSSVRPRLRLFLVYLQRSDSLWWTQNHPGPTLRFLRLNVQSTSF